MAVFPPIPLAEWVGTEGTIHRFLQIVGELRPAHAPRRNHWWHVPSHLTGRGLPTRPMGFDPVSAVELDLVDALRAGADRGRPTGRPELPGDRLRRERPPRGPGPRRPRLSHRARAPMTTIPRTVWRPTP